MSTTPFQCPITDGSYELQCQDVHPHYRYSEASAAWTLICAMIIFFMRAGFMMIELSFSSEVPERRNIVFLKYLDVTASAIGFWLFGFEISNINPQFITRQDINSANTSYINRVLVIENDITCNEIVPYIVWFFKFGFASNTATLMGGLLIGCKYKLRVFSAFLNAFVIAGIVHPIIGRIFWGADQGIDFLSPYRFCESPTGPIINDNSSFLERIHVLDFAGGGAVHLVGGMASLALTLIVSAQLWWDNRTQKKKKSQEKQQGSNGAVDDLEDNDRTQKTFKQRLLGVKSFIYYMYPINGGDDNIEQAASGVFILWFGWFAFNCGTTESMEGPYRDFPVYSNVAGRIAVNMITSAAGGGITATLIATTVQTCTKGKAINCNEIANGILTSLVAITSNCPYVDSVTAFYIGVIAVLLYHLGVYLEYLTNIFDRGRVIPVHAIGGMWSLLAGGLLAVHNAEKSYIRETYEGVCFCKLTLPTLSYGERLGSQIIGILLVSSITMAVMFSMYILLFLFRIDYILKLGNTKVGNAISDALEFGKGGILMIGKEEEKTIIIPWKDTEHKGSQLSLHNFPGDATTTVSDT